MQDRTSELLFRQLVFIKSASLGKLKEFLAFGN